MKLHLLAVGKLKDRGLRAVADDYASRIQRYTTLREVELKDGSEAELLTRLRKTIPPKARVVALEVEGRPLSSHQLAEWVGNCEQTAVSDVAFVIGGAYGLPPSFSADAHMQLSMSKMILPHRLARIVLLEQIYRAFTILRGEPYSH